MVSLWLALNANQLGYACSPCGKVNPGKVEARKFVRAGFWNHSYCEGQTQDEEAVHKDAEWRKTLKAAVLFVSRPGNRTK